MAKIGVRLKINCSQIEKARLFVGKKGHYLDATVFIDLDELDQYDNSGMITQDVSKEEKDQGVKGNILGNCQVFWVENGQAPQKGGAPAQQQAPMQAAPQQMAQPMQQSQHPTTGQMAPQQGQMQQAPTMAQQQQVQQQPQNPNSYDDTIPF